MSDSATHPDKDYVYSVRKCFELLNCFKPGRPHLSNAELAASTGYPRSTVARFTATLCDLGYLAVTPTQAYRLTSKVLELGYSYLEQFEVRRTLEPFLKEVSVHTGAGCSLGARDGAQMIYINQSSRGLRIDLPHPTIGSRVPIMQTAMGHAFLFGLTEEARAAALEELAPHYDAQWAQCLHLLDESFAQLRTHGFCFLDRSYRNGMSSVAIPFVSPGTGEALAINCAAPSHLLSQERALHTVGPYMLSRFTHARSFLNAPAPATSAAF